MFKKLREKSKAVYYSGAVATAGLMLAPGIARADVLSPTSMLDEGVVSVVSDFAADIVPTVLALIVILVPVGLTLWGIGFAVKKGINYIQSRAKQAV